MLPLRTIVIALALGAPAISVAEAQVALRGVVTPLAAGRLQGVGSIVRYAVARPDRREVAYVFLAKERAAGDLPEEVQVRGAKGEPVHLTAQQGADCTLSAVEVVTPPAGRGSVVTAVRRFSPVLSDNDYSAPGPMDIQLYRPVRGGEPGQSSYILQAIGAPTGTPPLCGAADVRRAMLLAAKGGK